MVNVLVLKDFTEEPSGDLIKDLIRSSSKDPLETITAVFFSRLIDTNSDYASITPTEKGILIEYVQGGELQPSLSLPKYIHPPLVEHIKTIIDTMDVSVTGVQQEGNLIVKYKGNEYNYKIFVGPMKQGQEAIEVALAA